MDLNDHDSAATQETEEADAASSRSGREGQESAWREEWALLAEMAAHLA